MNPGQTINTTSSAVWNVPNIYVGMLPAMGLGNTHLGYITANYPFTCQPLGGTNVTNFGNSPLAQGAICEVGFDRNKGNGTGNYSLTVNGDASVGPTRYEFGYVCNDGCTWSEPNFQVEIVDCK
jgi:hypothetical protein